MAELKDWNAAAASNNGTPPDGAPEGMAPSAVNDVIRENMAVLARWKGDNDGTLDSGGSSNAYTLTPNATYSAYARGDTFTFEANHTNTGSATLNVSSLGAKTIKDVTGNTLAPDRIVSGGVYQVVYDGTDFLLLNPALRVVEGTWVPRIEFSNATTGITYTTQTGVYRRIGDVVYFHGHVKLTSKGSETGIATIHGLPLSVSDELSGTSVEGLCSVGYSLNMASLTSAITAGVINNAGSDYIDIRHWGATGTTDLSDANFTNTSEMSISGFYITDEA